MASHEYKALSFEFPNRTPRQIVSTDGKITVTEVTNNNRCGHWLVRDENGNPIRFEIPAPAQLPSMMLKPQAAVSFSPLELPPNIANHLRDINNTFEQIAQRLVAQNERRKPRM